MYITIADLNLEFGKANVRKWADLDNDSSTSVETRVNAAISEAEDEFHAALRGGRYALPLSNPDGTVRFILRGMAIWKLYSARGLLDADEEKPKLEARRKESERRLTQVLTDELKLDCGSGYSLMPRIPMIVPL